jgi:hypothetical protein
MPISCPTRARDPDMQESILYPVIAMVGLTITIWVVLYRRRVAELRRSRINPQRISTSQDAASVLKDVTAADNFRNLFEVPVLFYILCLSLYVTQTVTSLLLGLAWVFVVLRGLHSYIHVTYNKVMHRFIVYLVSCLCLWAMWGIFAGSIIIDKS